MSDTRMKDNELDAFGQMPSFATMNWQENSNYQESKIEKVPSEKEDVLELDPTAKETAPLDLPYGDIPQILYSDCNKIQIWERVNILLFLGKCALLIGIAFSFFIFTDRVMPKISVEISSKISKIIPMVKKIRFFRRRSELAKKYTKTLKITKENCLPQYHEVMEDVFKQIQNAFKTAKTFEVLFSKKLSLLKIRIEVKTYNKRKKTKGRKNKDLFINILGTLRYGNTFGRYLKKEIFSETGKDFQALKTRKEHSKNNISKKKLIEHREYKDMKIPKKKVPKNIVKILQKFPFVVKNYMFLKKDHLLLNMKMQKLAAQFSGLSFPDVIDVYNKATPYLEKMADVIDGVKRNYKQGNWRELLSYKNQLEKYQKRTSEYIQLQKAIKKAIEKIQKTSKKASAFVRKKQTNEEYMGVWYAKLKEYALEIESLTNKSFSLPDKGTSIRLNHIKNAVRKIKNYPKDISEMVRSLEKTLRKGKDPIAWIKKHKQKALSLSKVKQLKTLEFMVKDKKFNIILDIDWENFKEAIGHFRIDIENGTLEAQTAKKLLKFLQEIDRKYEPKRQSLNSAIINFEFQD